MDTLAVGGTRGSAFHPNHVMVNLCQKVFFINNNNGYIYICVQLKSWNIIKHYRYYGMLLGDAKKSQKTLTRSALCVNIKT